MQYLSTSFTDKTSTLSKVPSFSILLDQGKSIDQLSFLHRAGYSVIRSSHAGNLQASNLAILEQGYPFLLHEYLSLDEPNYLPCCKRFGDTKVMMALPSNKIGLWEPCAGVNIADNPYLSPIHIHVQEIKRIWTNAIELSSFILSIGQENISRILNKFLDIDLEIVQAYIDQNGIKHPIINFNRENLRFESDIDISLSETRSIISCFFDMTSRCLTKFTRPEATILPDIAVFIVLTTIAELINPDRIYQSEIDNPANVYHIAGVQMVNYLINNTDKRNHLAERINRLYREARVVIPNLPERVIFNLVPSAHLSNYVTVQGRESLQEILKLASQFKDLNDDYSQEKARLLKKHQEALALVKTFEDLKCFIASSLIEFVNLRELLNEDYLERQFNANPNKIKNKLVGVFAKNITSSKLIEIESELEMIKKKMSAMKKLNAVAPRMITQYDLIQNGEAGLIPEIVLSHSPKELASLMKIIQKS